MAIHAPSIDVEAQRWTNDQVIRKCQDRATGRIKTGCLLDQYYDQLVGRLPKDHGHCENFNYAKAPGGPRVDHVVLPRVYLGH